MESYTLTERSIPLEDGWDVVVVGGGPAGCTTAAAAAREGARTLLVEATGCLGGMGTAGLVPAWCPFTDGEKMIYGGMTARVFEECKAGMPHVKPEEIHGWLPLDPERLKRIYDDLVTGAGASVRFHTRLAAVDMAEPGVVSTLILSDKSGLRAVRAKVYADCSGDADLAAWAGAAFQMGTDDTGECMPFTHCFLLSNVDSYAFQNYYDPTITGNWGFKESPLWPIRDSGKYPAVGGMCANLVGPGTVGMNAGHQHGIDPLDPVGLSGAYIQGRKIAEEYRRALAEFFPQAFGNAYLAATGSLMGVRESRRIIGDYCLTVADYRDKRSFADEICRNCYMIDIHGPRTPEQEAWYDNFLRTTPGNRIHQPRQPEYPNLEKGDSHGVPYRCLVPRDLKNVVVAGRTISCERTVQASIRVMPVVLAMGEAAGIAAAHAVQAHDCDVHAVDTGRLRARLKEEGGYLPPV